MSFGGGGGGSSVISAHKHTNASGEGGSLDESTLLEDVPLTVRVLVGV